MSGSKSSLGEFSGVNYECHIAGSSESMLVIWRVVERQSKVLVERKCSVSEQRVIGPDLRK